MLEHEHRNTGVHGQVLRHAAMEQAIEKTRVAMEHGYQVHIVAFGHVAQGERNIISGGSVVGVSDLSEDLVIVRKHLWIGGLLPGWPATGTPSSGSTASRARYG